MPNIFRHIIDSLWPEDSVLRRNRFYLTLSGFILAIAWPPFPLGFIALIALIIPLDVISGKKFGPAFKSSYLFAFVYHLFSIYWIAWVTVPGALAAMALISLYTAFILAIYSAIYRRFPVPAMALLPFLWVGMEYFRSLLEIAFPWPNLSYTQHGYLAFIQISEFVGDLGISFIVVFFNILLWRIWRGKNRFRRAGLALSAGLIICLPTLYGAHVLGQAPEDHDGPISVALLQGSVDLETKWDPEMKEFNFRLYDSLAKAAPPVDLLVWPETAAPAYLLGNFRYTRMVSQTARKVKTPMLVGTLDFNRLSDSTYEYFNAAVHFDSDGQHRPPYHKTKLVPFAETVSYGDYVPWLVNLSLGWSDFEHGRELKVFENDFGNYGTLICYEVIFPEVVNQYIRDGADFLINITNDTWYGYSSGPYQHAVMAVFRSIENRIYIARAANSGFSYFVDKYGRMYNKSGLYEQVILTGNLYPAGELTTFNRTGPVLGRAGLLIIGLLSLILAAVWIKEKFWH
ncbi:MAG: apolipoprotein N-acyltransferase [FCB group bacterium]|nr:apolipoprotein N-acyltransferase [FCB group bacterium]